MFLLKHLGRRPNILKTLKMVGPFPYQLALCSASTRDGNAHTLTTHTPAALSGETYNCLSTEVSPNHTVANQRVQACRCDEDNMPNLPTEHQNWGAVTW